MPAVAGASIASTSGSSAIAARHAAIQALLAAVDDALTDERALAIVDAIDRALERDDVRGTGAVESIDEVADQTRPAARGGTGHEHQALGFAAETRDRGFDGARSAGCPVRAPLDDAAESVSIAEAAQAHASRIGEVCHPVHALGGEQLVGRQIGREFVEKALDCIRAERRLREPFHHARQREWPAAGAARDTAWRRRARPLPASRPRMPDAGAAARRAGSAALTVLFSGAGAGAGVGTGSGRRGAAGGRAPLAADLYPEIIAGPGRREQERFATARRLRRKPLHHRAARPQLFEIAGAGSNCSTTLASASSASGPGAISVCPRLEISRGGVADVQQQRVAVGVGQRAQAADRDHREAGGSAMGRATGSAKRRAARKRTCSASSSVTWQRSNRPANHRACVVVAREDDLHARFPAAAGTWIRRGGRWWRR